MPYPTASELYEVAGVLTPIDAGLVTAAADELVERRKAMRLSDEQIARIKAEAIAIADALGQRGLIDLADDVRMLTKI